MPFFYSRIGAASADNVVHGNDDFLRIGFLTLVDAGSDLHYDARRDSSRIEGPVP